MPSTQAATHYYFLWLMKILVEVGFEPKKKVNHDFQ
jgi:hypothetical protein